MLYKPTFDVPHADGLGNDLLKRWLLFYSGLAAGMFLYAVLIMDDPVRVAGRFSPVVFLIFFCRWMSVRPAIIYGLFAMVLHTSISIIRFLGSLAPPVPRIGQEVLKAVLVVAFVALGFFMALFKNMERAMPNKNPWHSYAAGALAGAYFIPALLFPRTLVGAVLGFLIVASCILFAAWGKAALLLSGCALVALDVGVRLGPWEPPALPFGGRAETALMVAFFVTLVAMLIFAVLFRRKKSCKAEKDPLAYYHRERSHRLLPRPRRS